MPAYEVELSQRFWSTLLSVISAIALVAAVGHRVWGWSPGDLAVAWRSRAIPLDRDRVLGNPKAGVAIIVYSDFHCPACRRFSNETLPQIRARYIASGQVVMAYRHYPLEGVHPLAFQAAKVAVCADQQHLFWEMHDVLFRGPSILQALESGWTPDRLDLDSSQLRACLADSKADDVVRADQADGARLGIDVTPTFLVGSVDAKGRLRVSRRLSGAAPVEQFNEVLEALLSSKRAGSTP